MRIIRNRKEMTSCALSLGNFDGMHKAHVKIVNNCTEFARNNQIPGGILLFENHPHKLCTGREIKYLTSFEEKCGIAEKLGADFVFAVKFDEWFMTMSQQEFFSYLTEDLKAKALFAGFNYSFGYMAEGNAKKLLEMGKENGVYVNICGEIDDGEGTISSTRIRNYIINGEVGKAANLLGRNYSVYGEVVHGKQNGRKMGLPTANVWHNEDKLLPNDGVYFGYTTVDKIRYKSLINVGKNPTFGDNNRTVESHIMDFNDEIYGQKINVEFVDKIRGEIKFTSSEDLKRQIESDLIKVQNRKD